MTKDDTELREIIGDSVGNPDKIAEVEERVRRKGRDILSPKTGLAVSMTVTFKAAFDPLDTYIWLELYAEPLHGDIDTIGNFTALPLDAKLKYSTEQAAEALPSMFHNITDLKFQDNWERVWVDLSTSDLVAMDVLVNALSAVSHVGIKQLVFGGQKLGDWAEGLNDLRTAISALKFEVSGMQIANLY